MIMRWKRYQRGLLERHDNWKFTFRCLSLKFLNLCISRSDCLGNTVSISQRCEEASHNLGIFFSLVILLVFLPFIWDGCMPRRVLIKDEVNEN